MARIIAKTIIYLCLTCSIISADESNNEDAQNEAVETGYKTPEVSGFAYLVETFDDEEKFKKTWVLSEAKKDSTDEDIAKYDGPSSIIQLKHLHVFDIIQSYNVHYICRNLVCRRTQKACSRG